MSEVIATAQIPLGADALWHKISAFGAIGDWHPMLDRADSEGDKAGATRTAYA